MTNFSNMEENPKDKQTIKGFKCPKCKQYTGKLEYTDQIHGNIYTPAADTEVEHHYQCRNPDCKHSWSESA